MKTITISVAFLFFSLVAMAQEEVDNPEITPEQPKVETKEVVVTPKVESVIVIFNEDNMNKLLVVSTGGKWVHDARGITIETEIGSDKPARVTCTMYRGLFKPTKPEIQIWELKELMTATNADFQKILDGLQNDKFELPVNTTDK